MKRRHLLAALAAPGALLGGCVSVGAGDKLPPHAHHRLTDASIAPIERRSAPIVSALLIQPLPADALADTLSIAYSRRANEFAFYQLASWTERPVRLLPRLLQRRLEARGMAGAVGLIGEPLRADWLITLGVDTLHHDVSAAPGRARVALTIEVFDRRQRVRVARQQFASDVGTPTADSATATAALSQALAQAFDVLLPWLESVLERAAAA